MLSRREIPVLKANEIGPREYGKTHVKRFCEREGDNPKNGFLQTPYRKWKYTDVKKDVLKRSRTRTSRAKAQEEYTAADKEVKRNIKKDKRDYVDDMVKEADEAAGKGNLRDMYMLNRKL